MRREDAHPTPVGVSIKRRPATKTVMVNIKFEPGTDYELIVKESIARMNAIGLKPEKHEICRMCDYCSKQLPKRAKDTNCKCNLCGKAFDVCRMCRARGFDTEECPRDYGCKFIIPDGMLY